MSKTTSARRRRGWIKRILMSALASLIVLAGLLVGGLRLLDHFAPQYRNALAERIGQRIDAQVSVSGLAIGWGWYGPILYLNQPRITHHGAKKPALTADRLGLEFSLSELISGSRLPDGLIIDAPHAGLVASHGGLKLAHWSRSNATGINWSKLTAVRHQIAHVRIHNGQLSIASDRLPGGHMQWSNLRLVLDDHGDHRLEVAASASGPAWWPKVDARTTIIGRLRRPERARFSLHGPNIHTLVIARQNQIKLASRLRGGQLSFDVDGHWRHHRLTDTRITLAGTALTRAGGPSPLIPAFKAVVKVSSNPAAHRIDLDLARLTGGPKQSAELGAKAHFNTRSHAVAVSARHLPETPMLRIARLAEPRLRQTAVSGSIDNFDLHWRPGQPLAVGVGFHGLTVDDPKLAFGPIAGRYHQQGDRHTLRFDGAGGMLSAKRYIKGKVDISGLSGQLGWQPGAGGGWSIGLDKLRLASRQAYIKSSGHIRVPGQGAPVVDVSADVVAPHIARLLAHIPQAPDLPNPRLRHWLSQAISAGSLDHGHVAVKGPMNRFPFAQQAAHGHGFHMTLSGHGLNVRYKRQWPKITEARGRISLDGDRLALDLTSAKMLGVTIARTQAHIADMREPVMHLTGRIHDAPARKLMSFLSQSPLHKRFGPLVNAIDIEGPADLGVALRIPLKPGLGAIQVNGHAQAKSDTLRQHILPGPITGIRGALAFSTHGVKASGLTGRLKGVPISADIAKTAGGGQRITAHAKPSLPADRAVLAYYLPVAWLIYAKGKAPMTVTFTVKPSGRISPIRIDSDLAGMAIRLPAPLVKPAQSQAPLAVTVEPGGRQIKADYDHRLHLAIALNEHGRPKRIQARIGSTQLTPPHANGLWIGGHVGQLDGLGWFHVVRHVLYGAPAQVPGAQTSAGQRTKQPSAAPALAFLGGNLSIGRLNFGPRYIANPRLRARPLSRQSGWHVEVKGKDSQGWITWTMPAHQPPHISGHLKRLALHTGSDPSSRSGDAGGQPHAPVLWPHLAPTQLPALKLAINNLVLDGTSFGQGHIDATGTPDGWHLDRFQLADGALTGQASAYWQQDSGITQASAQADFEGHGLSRLLSSLGSSAPIRAKRARIQGVLRIKPNPHGLDLRHLAGHVHLALDHGTLLSVSPGPGRLLGLFNLYVLPRRLRLDFRDVVDKGMAFDKMRADFNIRQGQAYSKNARILTPSVKIGMTGRIGLANRDYDEHVTITPQVGSGLAIAGAVLGGPIVGAAVFAAQQLLKQPIQDFSSIDYHLKGSWDNPHIVKAHANANDDHPTDSTNTNDTSGKSGDAGSTGAGPTGRRPGGH